jgi:ERCC4-type nuclease
MKIHVDNRESKVIPFFKDIEGIDREVSTLKRGDYVISYNNQILHLFERKSMSDLVGSLKSSNLHIENMIEARKETNCKLGYILEHKRVFYADTTVVKGIEWHKLNALLETIYLQFDIPIILTQDYEGTANKITQFAQRYKKLIEKGHTFNITGGLNLLTDKIEKTMDGEIKKMWLSMPGVGEETAKVLMKNYSFIELLSEDIENIRKISIGGRTIGKGLDKTMLDYKGDNGPIHRKLLSAIQGVSDQKALRILAVHSFKDLINADLNNMLFNSKKLGIIGDRIKNQLSYKCGQ